MTLDAWQTVWVCVVLSVAVLLLDGFFAHRAGPGKAELARKARRDRRSVGNEGTSE